MAEKCPHCLTAFVAAEDWTNLGSDEHAAWRLECHSCPECGHMIITLCRNPEVGEVTEMRVYPRTQAREPVPECVGDEFAGGYRAACAVLADSPEASAALSRRCPQHLIRERGGITKQTLAAEIDELLKAKTLPAHIAEDLDAVRNIGNFAAHATQNIHTGETLAVLPSHVDLRAMLQQSVFTIHGSSTPLESAPHSDD